MKRLIISFLLLLFGPLSQRSTLPVTIEFSDFESNDIVSYSFYIPRGFRHMELIEPDMNWGETYVHEYKYSNGSLFYVGNSSCCPNGYAIELLNSKKAYGYIVGNVLAQDVTLKQEYQIPERWDLSGTNFWGKCWRDVQTFSWDIGYKNVPRRDKATFDQIIDNFISEYYESGSR